MNRGEYIKLIDLENTLITVSDLKDKSDRTLLYGYNFNRITHHSYIKDDEIVSVMYSYNEEPVKLDVDHNSIYVPMKRIYPEASDYEFCKLLKEKGYHLNFLPFNDEREERQFHGKIL